MKLGEISRSTPTMPHLGGGGKMLCFRLIESHVAMVMGAIQAVITFSFAGVTLLITRVF